MQKRLCGGGRRLTCRERGKCLREWRLITEVVEMISFPQFRYFLCFLVVWVLVMGLGSDEWCVGCRPARRVWTATCEPTRRCCLGCRNSARARCFNDTSLYTTRTGMGPVRKEYTHPIRTPSLFRLIVFSTQHHVGNPDRKVAPTFPRDSLPRGVVLVGEFADTGTTPQLLIRGKRDPWPNKTSRGSSTRWARASSRHHELAEV